MQKCIYYSEYGLNIIIYNIAEEEVDERKKETSTENFIYIIPRPCEVRIGYIFGRDHEHCLTDKYVTTTTKAEYIIIDPACIMPKINIEVCRVVRPAARGHMRSSKPFF